MTRLSTAIYRKINQDVMVKKAKYRAITYNNNQQKSALIAHCKAIAESPAFLGITALTSLLALRYGKFATLRRLVMLKRVTDSLMTSSLNNSNNNAPFS